MRKGRIADDPQKSKRIAEQEGIRFHSAVVPARRTASQSAFGGAVCPENRGALRLGSRSAFRGALSLGIRSAVRGASGSRFPIQIATEDDREASVLQSRRYRSAAISGCS